jgi:hypothetical protein
VYPLFASDADARKAAAEAMAVSIDSQTALSAAGALLSGVSRVLVWSLITGPIYVYRLVSLLASPLTVSLACILRAVLFLLSPVFLVLGFVANTGGYLIDAAVRAKVSLLSSLQFLVMVVPV